MEKTNSALIDSLYGLKQVSSSYTHATVIDAKEVTMEDIAVKRFYDNQAPIVEKAAEKCKNNPKYDLSDEERFAIALLAGARIERLDPVDEFGKSNIVLEKCGVVWIGDKFQVAVMARGSRK